MDEITLQPITPDNLGDVLALSKALRDNGQDRFVADNAVSLAQAWVHPRRAWPRAICAGDTPVGFLMLEDDPAQQRYFLWRLMVGCEHQGKGVGRRAIELLVEHVRTRPGATELKTSCVQAEGGPEGFYRSLGFEPDGEMHGEELGLSLPLGAGTSAAATSTTSPSTDPSCFPDYAQVNRDNWNRGAAGWAESGREDWAREEPHWGIWRIPNADLPLLPADMTGVDAIELGCGTGYVSSWMHRRGARVVGIDPSDNQLATARALAAEHGVDIEWIHGVAESVPKPDASFDFAISEYGAAIWADPEVWIPEARRLLRPGGELVFLGHTPFVQVCTPLEEEGRAGWQLQHPYFGMRRVDWTDVEADGGIEFNRPVSDWFALFRETGFEVIDFHELRAPEHWTEERFWVPAEWAKAYPSEQVWHLRRRG
jgi:SAM-dependent methyltransferase/GNAT superfamily N-acetyltransferase